MPKFSKILSWLPIVTLIGIGVLTPLNAMMVNLPVPYKPDPSPPRSLDLTFFAPGNDTFLFEQGKPVRIVCQPTLRALQLEWTLSHNMVKKPLLSGTVLTAPGNTFPLDLPVEKLAPGFYDVRVKVKLTNDLFREGITTIGWQVGKMPIHAVCPADFQQFWKSAVGKLDQISAKPTFVLEKTLSGQEIDRYNIEHAALPESYDSPGIRYEQVEIYRVSFASINGKTIHGWFAKPVGAGPFPALLVLPGAGNKARPAPVEHARHGYAALDIQVHGEEVDLEQYAPIPKDDDSHVEGMVHYGIYLNALQGARALRLLPGVDSNRLAVLGGSQGGRLSVVVAALDPGIRAAILAITHYAYMPWHHWMKRMNKENASGAEGFTADSPEATATGGANSYLDVLNFAPLIHCPVLMNSGLIDPISPATGVFAVYARLSGPKEMISLPNTGHDWSPAFDRMAWPWLDNKLATQASNK